MLVGAEDSGRGQMLAPLATELVLGRLPIGFGFDRCGAGTVAGPAVGSQEVVASGESGPELIAEPMGAKVGAIVAGLLRWDRVADGCC